MRGIEYINYHTQRVKEYFKDHATTVAVANEHVMIIDWRNKNGSGEYAIRYILDLDKGNIIISGDLGDAIASWYGKKTALDLVSYTNDIEYFISKIKCSTDLYTYDKDDILEDLGSLKDELIDTGDVDTADLDEDIDELASLIEEAPFDKNGGIYPTSEIEDLLEKYEYSWWESGLSSSGQRIAPRVIFWQIGLQMAWDNSQGVAEPPVEKVVNDLNQISLTADECSSVYKALLDQKAVIAGKLWTTNEIKLALEDIAPDVDLPDNVVNHIAGFIHTSLLEELVNHEKQNFRVQCNKPVALQVRNRAECADL